MKKVMLDKTNIKVSNICLGIADIGNRYTQEYGYKIMDAFFEKGGNFIDTARIYSDWVPGEKNRSERILGDWIKDRGNREQVVLATKGGHLSLETLEKRLSKEEVSYDLNGSLKTLQTDYIDVYYLHRDDPERPVEEIMDYLQSFADEGKIRYYACSNWTAGRILEAEKYCREMQYTGFCANQMLWNIGCYNMKPIADKTMVVYDKETDLVMREYNITAVPYSSQASGYFTKKFSGSLKEREKAEKSGYNTEKNKNLAEFMKKTAHILNMTITELTLSYLLSQTLKTIPIIGCGTIEQLNDSLSAGDRIIPNDILEELEKAAVG